ncbi:MAG: hypothetical protein A3F74_12405 [Betaproteobacteria bacterium RIFCSPLOWO2_12_FULL_62_58]|nr:MAG: hypothetical protein A3F74_12405 [Betaproteobacteria bacterium RIFCSPLOWO2_12_FULL_62_58]
MGSPTGANRNAKANETADEIGIGIHDIPGAHARLAAFRGEDFSTAVIPGERGIMRDKAWSLGDASGGVKVIDSPA